MLSSGHLWAASPSDTCEKAVHRELPTKQDKWGTINTHNSQQEWKNTINFVESIM